MEKLVQPSEEIVKVFNKIWNNEYNGEGIQLFEGGDKVDVSDYIKDLKGLCEQDKKIRKAKDLKSFLEQINSVYHTRVNDIEKLTTGLKECGIDSRETLENKARKEVNFFNEFVNLCRQETGKYTYSFASKVFSFIDSNKYPIIDSYVATLLDAYVYKGKIKKSQWGNYDEYIKNYKCFKEHFRLNSFSFKEVDIFLWCYGKVLEEYWEKQGVITFSSVSYNANR